MSDQEMWDSFVAGIGGRERLEALVQASVRDPESIAEPDLWDEIAALYEANDVARADLQAIAVRLAEAEGGDKPD